VDIIGRNQEALGKEIMPKNSSWGQNTKAVEAKARKATVQKAQEEKKKKAQEDAYWEDDDKQLAKKQNRKDEKEKKRLEQLERKQINKQLAEEEVVVEKKSTQAPAKITQAQIQAERERREAAARKSAAAVGTPKVPKPAPVEENLNRLTAPDEEARTVDEALKMLKVVEDSPSVIVDKHPERRVKAAYAAFEEARMPQVKAENPSLRLTQLKQLIFNEWKKSPENPMNQETVVYEYIPK
jgi:hypothetical protein